jgi:iron complex outermembrane recepter protein
MKPLLLLLFSVVYISTTYGQNSITGIVVNEQGLPVSNAIVLLYNNTDTTAAKQFITNAAGAFSIKATKGAYHIGVVAVGYKKMVTPSFTFNNTATLSIATITLVKAVTTLAGVTVTSKKPLVEVTADKTIVNVEGTINAVGSNALDLLRKSPGVQLDNDDNIAMAGKNGVQVFIDGKPSPLGGADLVNFLQNLQSSQIEAIELITNPSAKYEAAGNAGIINIRLKKNKALGTNGAINAGYGIGIHAKYNAGLSLNHRNKKVNVFGNYNINSGLTYNDFRINRSVLDTSFMLKSDRSIQNTAHNFKTGLDYFIDKKNTIGVMVNGNIAYNTNFNFSNTGINYQPTNTPNRILVANNITDVALNNINFNTNYKYSNANAQELNVDADYGLYRNKNNLQQPNIYYNPAGTTELSRAIYYFIAPTNIDIFSLKADYEQNFAKGKLGLGGKTSYVKTDNRFERYNANTGTNIFDAPRSNQFDYRENINAIYANYNRKWKTITLQAGLRVENTVSEGTSYSLLPNGFINYSGAASFKRNYTNLFPSIAISFTKNLNSQFSIAYSRRIDRPAYQDLNPFEFKLDEYNYRKGNPDLIPQYTNTIGITYVYKSKLISKLSYSHVQDVFAQITDTIEKSKSFITNKNLATQNIFNLSISYPITYKWYTAFIALNTYYTKYMADFGGGTRVINLDVTAFNINMQNSFKLGKGFTGEVSGNYNSPTIWQGTFKSRAQGGLDIGLQKSILKGRANIKALVTDIFLTQKFNGISNFAGSTGEINIVRESRQFKLNFTYRFGSNQVKAARARVTGLEEENKRIQNSGQ